jgi:NADPH2:quinone reductase
MKNSMRAMVLEKYGGPDVFELREVAIPRAGPGEVLVRIIASGTNPVEAKIRATGGWAGHSLPVIIGYDAAGIIESAGPGVKDFVPGDEVYFTPEISGNTHGSYAEYTIAPAAIVARKPKNLSFIEAAAIPLAGGTAWEAIVRRLRLRLAETVLIHGAAGGVGSFAVQFAKAAGARIIATASAANRKLLQDLGADVVLDYHQNDLNDLILTQTNGLGVDAAFDIEGDQRVARCLPVVRPRGRIACILPPLGDLTLLYLKNITLHGVFLTREKNILEEMRTVFEQGKARPVIEQVLPLEQVSKAHSRLDSRHGHGKIILTVNSAGVG